MSRRCRVVTTGARRGDKRNRRRIEYDRTFELNYPVLLSQAEDIPAEPDLVMEQIE
jgi:hypothetical protein